jgi:phenylalanyl-tRNA synthetase beta chain
MRVPLGWLAEWIDLPDSLEVLVERLTAAGLEVEQILRTGPDLSALRIGRVRECGKHPDADRLSVCQVDVGESEPITIVCGAPNVAAGQKVAVAPVGSELPGGLKIKKSRIRGVASQGMICSAAELGLGEDASGILVLDPAAAVGAPLETVLSAGETVLDVEITPNRGDWVSLLGMAREVRASFGGPLRLPECEPRESGAPLGSALSIDISDRGGCARYVGRVVRGVRVGPSPDWLVARLEAAGLRSVNNVVDVTNLVMIEFGQPLHAFDLAKLRGGQVVVRAAQAGEKIRTLDGHLRELAREDLVISDAEGAVAVAGVMGGAESEVSETTQDLLLESAYFEPARVRRTARRLGLSSDASYRFERGVDPDEQGRAADRAARLIAELTGGEVAQGAIEATGDPVPPADPIPLSPARVNRLLGTALEPNAIRALLERIEVRVEAQGESLRCTPPRYRPDLRIAADLVEEVARIHGYDQLPSTLPAAAPAGITLPPGRETREAVRDALVNAGLYEIMTLPFVGDDDADGLRLDADDPRRQRVRVVNPIQAERPWLRTELLSSVLRAARGNRARQVDELRCFEVARVFRRGADGALPEEPMQAVGLLAPGAAPTLWGKQRAPVFFEAKGLAERLLGELGVSARFRGGAAEPFLHPGAAGEYCVGGARVLVLGELHPELQARFELEGPIAVLCVDIDALDGAGRKPAKHRELSRYPKVERDLAVLLASDAPAGDVARAIREAGGAALQHVEIFDRFSGRGVPEGRVSVAFRLVFQRLDRTLQEQEVSQALERVMTMLARRYGGELRERTDKQGEGP